jgi:hypothetical protein
VDPEDLTDVGRLGRRPPGPAGLLILTSVGNFFAYLYQDIARSAVAAEGRAIVAAAELRTRRAQTLGRIGAREVFPAGSVVLTGSDDRPDLRPVVVAVTDTDLVLLDADPQAPEVEFARVPRREVTGIRLLDEEGSPARPMTELEELDAPRRPCVLWVDRQIDGRPRGHVFVFPSYVSAAETERDFRRQLIPA